jgi:GT2 family glycosyltransferase/glycosyltransferase involved in cell wall biosynthesis
MILPHCWERIAKNWKEREGFLREQSSYLFSQRSLIQYNGPIQNLRLLYAVYRRLCQWRNAVVVFNKEGPASDIPVERVITAVENHSPYNKCISGGDESSNSADALEKTPPTLIAFYLPQYHPIPENDAWWGKGFTEWTNVAKARPLFEGHYQPHLPSDLGFYDLRIPEVRKAQADMAREYGIYGFCYYHYWFNERRLLERPFQDMLGSGQPDFPFCLCWANENWTRSWDGRDGAVLIKQDYCEEDDRNHMRWLLGVFGDKRYIRIREKPLMLIYRSMCLPDAARTVEIWREGARENGEELYICKVESSPSESGDPLIGGFDASVEFQPDWGNLGPAKKRVPGGHVVYDYPQVAQRMIDKPIPPYKRYPCVTPMWDNSPRKKEDSLIIDNSSPECYEMWLRTAIGKLSALELDDNIVFINAWNEWGEGNHLEPDERHGKAYLEATKKALFRKPAPVRIKSNGLVSIIIPVFNNAAFTRKCLAAVHKNTAGCSYEVIVIDNASTDETPDLLKSCDLQSLTVISNRENVGFTKACNQGARRASGEFVLFLNNDTEPQPGWLDALLDLMWSDDRIGIAGCKLVYPDGRLQEAGGIIFNDGSGWNYGRLDDPNDPRYCYVREVDYVSGAALLVHHDLLRRLNYFDEHYSSGYYEDTDLCFGARSLGYKVMYSPFSIVVHHEGASSGRDIGRGMKQHQAVNKQKFVRKWASALEEQYPPDSGSVTMASSRRIAGNLLIIDPFLPMFDRASGSLRLFSIISLLKQQGYHVTYIARDGRYQQERYSRILERMGVEVYATDPAGMREMGCRVSGRPIDLKQLLTSRPYSVACLSYYTIARQYLSSIRSLSPLTRIVIDTVDIHFLRKRREAELSRDPAAMERAESTKKAELAIYTQADALITVTEHDWRHIEAYLPAKPHFVIPNIHSVADSKAYSPNRSGLLFIGGFKHSPNTDAVLYFIKEISPLLKKAVPDITLEVVGDNPPDSIRELRDKDVTVTGYVPSTEPYLQKARVSIAPLRYGAGMKGKIGEAMAHGVPVVTTSVGAEGIGLVHGETAFIADTPAEFAQHVVKLYSDDGLWSIMSENARLFIKNNYSPQVVSTAVHNMMSRLAEIEPHRAELSTRTTPFAFRLRRFLALNISWDNYDDAYQVWKQYKRENIERHHQTLKKIGEQYGVCLFFLLYPLYKIVKPFRKLTRKLLGRKRSR